MSTPRQHVLPPTLTAPPDPVRPSARANGTSPHGRGAHARCALAAIVTVAGASLSLPALARQPAPAQPAPPRDRQPIDDPFALFENRLVREVRIEGASPTNEQLARNQVRTQPGQPLSPATVRADIQTLTRLGRFGSIDAVVIPYEDQSVAIVYRLTEVPVITGVDVVGNRQISDQEIAGEVAILSGTPVDRFQIDRAARRIEDLYRRKGFYLAQVTVDERELEQTGVVLFRVLERDRVKVTDIRFAGNRAFSAGQLRPEIRTKVAGIFETGPLDDDVLDQDVAAVIQFYRNRGYLDVRADREVTASPDGREAVVVFIVDEGPQYTLRSVRAELPADERMRPGGRPPTVFSPEQIAGIMTIKAGDAYAVNRVEASVAAVREAYGKLGYVDARVDRFELRDPERPFVDLLLVVSEGARFKTGLVPIVGNDLTQSKVIRRHIRIYPDRPLDTVALADSQRRINDTRLFRPGSVRLTIQPPDPTMPEHRDVLVEVEETNTGSVTFGVGVNSDAGVLGSFSITQRNFDIADLPDSFEELITGRAFRGGGQTFNLTLAPGTRRQLYMLSLSEPYFLESDFSVGGSAFFSTSEYVEYDEQRLGTQFSIGRRFGERWEGSLTGRVIRVDLRDIEEDAPTEVFRFDDPAVITGLGARLVRTTVDNRFRPTRGTRTDLSIEQVGVLGGDFDFTRMAAEHTLFLPVYEDFLGRRTVLSFKTAVGYIPQDIQDVPVYERFYLGGRNFRGFRFRTVSPKGIANNTGEPTSDPVGGGWSFFFGGEIEQPIFQDIVSGVLFVDSGTVLDNPGFDDYRVAVGFGVRLSVPQLGPVPLAFDFGFPVIKGPRDQSRLFSFSVDLPF